MLGPAALSLARRCRSNGHRAIYPPTANTMRWGAIIFVTTLGTMHFPPPVVWGWREVVNRSSAGSLETCNTRPARASPLHGLRSGAPGFSDATVSITDRFQLAPCKVRWQPQNETRDTSGTGLQLRHNWPDMRSPPRRHFGHGMLTPSP